jgi:phosphopantothenoylcysteine decarboxylase/phosphopantothenate--cysteine ligase
MLDGRGPKYLMVTVGLFFACAITAAVSDYRPKAAAHQKLKRSGPMSLELEPTQDILAELVSRKTHQLMIGFAAESCSA